MPADTAAVQQLGKEENGFRVSDTGVFEELGERFGSRVTVHLESDFPLCSCELSTESGPGGPLDQLTYLAKTHLNLN